jgi:hypothetical protein
MMKGEKGTGSFFGSSVNGVKGGTTKVLLLKVVGFTSGS